MKPNEKSHCAGHIEDFLLPTLQKTSFLRAENKNAAYFTPGFFFVDKRFEIPNLDLISDIDRIFKLEEIKSK
jgi:hypothetical protein